MRHEATGESDPSHAGLGRANAALRRRFRAIREDGYASERLVVYVLEEPGGAIQKRKCEQNLQHPGEIGLVLCARGGRAEGLELERRDLPDAALGGSVREALPGGTNGNRGDPPLGGLWVTQVVQIAMHRQENILNDVIHIIARAQDALTDPGHVANILPEQDTGVVCCAGSKVSGRRFAARMCR